MIVAILATILLGYAWGRIKLTPSISILRSPPERIPIDPRLLSLRKHFALLLSRCLDLIIRDRNSSTEMIRRNSCVPVIHARCLRASSSTLDMPFLVP